MFESKTLFIELYVFYLINIINANYVSDMRKRGLYIYEKLDGLSRKSEFSKIQMGFKQKCPNPKIESCKTTDCTVETVSFEGKDGVIDLLATIEGYSKSSRGGPMVWKMIYNSVEENSLFVKLVSGLHFSVTTHISLFYRNIFGIMFLSNPGHFNKAYKEEYRRNFLSLYELYWEALCKIGNGERSGLGISQEDNNVLELSEMMRDYNKDNRIEYEIPKIGPEYIDTITMMTRYVACINCNKCLLWGTIQVRGLRAVVKILNGIPIGKDDRICMINGFRRLTETLVRHTELYRRKPTVVEWIGIYYERIFVSSVSVLLATCILLKLRYRGKK